MAHIRPAMRDEVPTIAAVHARAHRETYAPLFGAKARALDAGTLERGWRKALTGGDLVLVATDAGAIVGVGHARGHRIEALYLLAAHRRQGTGTALLACMLEAMHRRGIAAAECDVLAINNAAIAFYRSRGARQIGRKSHSDPGGDYEDAIFSIPTGPGFDS